MIKKIFLLLCSSNLLLANEFSTTQKVLIGGAIGSVVVAAAVVAAPLVLPASTVVAIKTTASAVAIKVGTAATAAAPVAKGITLGISAVQIAKPYIISTPDEGLSQLRKEQAAREFKAKNAFLECFTKNKLFPKNNSGYPDSCKQLACMFELISGQEEFNRTVKAFNK
jgi:hypothetical protein